MYARLSGLDNKPNYYKEKGENLLGKLPLEAVERKDKREEMCEVMSKYKYLVVIDGNVSSWARSA